ncbi:protoporphyrinogen oxidase HemJ [Allomesorhizobium camelthorni]|uniref:Protoporphyrinogen IX oxidase n=1 Tax=Allomesorhizobium camelthorni TaxID=475069 RepID=A0A6G4W6T1_9HYPH|nr:protoporphyrinogen oxidase HemJ [Mesorhizobium camelthorni]NGO49963.1 protoporphyrinogen oxidase HemJ [Mesorhizobium camelthorni]
MNIPETQQSGRNAAKRAAAAIAILVVLTALLFLLDPDNLYLWIKAVHVIAVISWMAGMLYLPRLFIYHTGAEPGSVQSETFKVMEQRLLRVIINPAMMVTWVLGLWLAWKGFGFSGGWLHAKIALVVVLSGVHGYLSGAVRKFAEDRNDRSARHWRLVNEVPTVLMIGIVILVVVKPF